tara:strand:+ start:514 stop:1026 length:513 start_codon:yes stop_codon:yes gene_type:complete
MPKVLTQIAFFFFGTRRRILGSILSASIYLLLFAFYMEYQLGLEPCPMCIVQRIGIALAGLIALIAIIHHKNLNWYFGLITLVTLGAAASASRHLYLQSLPLDQIPSCGPDLAYLIKFSYFGDALKMLFVGDGNCSEIVWSLLGISIPGWVLIACIQILLMASIAFKVKT